MCIQMKHEKKLRLCSICLREIGSCSIALSCPAILSYGSPITVVVSVFNDSSVVAICWMVKVTSTSRAEAVLPRNFGQDTTTANLCGRNV